MSQQVFRLFRLIAVAAFLAAGAPAHAQDLLAYWHFNDSNLTVDAGAGALTTNFPGGDVAYGSGATLNVTSGTLAGNALRLTSKNNNGDYLTFALDTTGYENLVLSYAALAGSNSFTTQTISYSLDGTTFLTAPAPSTTGVITPTESFAVYTFDFSAIDGLDGNLNAKVRITFSGAGSANNKYNYVDNVQFNATLLPEPASAATLAAAAMLLACGRGSRRA